MFFKGVIIVAGIALVVISVAVLLSYDFENSQDILDISENDFQNIIDITEQFIQTSPTFSFDGISNTLKVEIISSDVSDSKFLLEGKFKTLHTGFGNREKLDLPVDITKHTIEVVIVDGKIISAVIDNQWDELNQITCHTARC
jgi:hypothetical protein